MITQKHILAVLRSDLCVCGSLSAGCRAVTSFPGLFSPRLIHFLPEVPSLPFLSVLNDALIPGHLESQEYTVWLFPDQSHSSGNRDGAFSLGTRRPLIGWLTFAEKPDECSLDP